ncbi:TPA: hypothetical protein ACNHM3_002860 [Klebsiella pneumoniae]|uniref:hypothetical protein n=1 Tax=Klebsiella pneumoniae complex TaxID=3390273 RepID=UPI00058DDA27|nr:MULTISPECIES: hypothetical protein [Klebsiella]EIX9650557.1 hypothetical protein [Klebsiella pneumoniae]MBM1132965.1 hypothetical protein [Klebsiella pneumoniae]MBQ5284641.1 hypothetical protein [Klebsiella pneumoniae]MBW5990945.1 hypothetical protein [Klebsiella quasipneumoniae]MCB3461985.1 hypothetical protein [Klebsiella pneumoniae]
MSFVINKTLEASVIADSGTAIGSVQVTVDVTYTITLIQVIDDCTAYASVSASVNGQPPRQVDQFEFNYTLEGGKSLFEQAEDSITNSDGYSGATTV